jgi:hypothetical protein
METETVPGSGPEERRRNEAGGRRVVWRRLVVATQQADRRAGDSLRARPQSPHKNPFSCMAASRLVPSSWRGRDRTGYAPAVPFIASDPLAWMRPYYEAVESPEQERGHRRRRGGRCLRRGASVGPEAAVRRRDVEAAVSDRRRLLSLERPRVTLGDDC